MEFEVYLILLRLLDGLCAEQRKHIHIEILRRLRGWALIGQPHKEVAFAEDVLFRPVDAVLVNLAPCDVLGELQVGSIIHDGIEILIQAVFTEEIRFFLYLFIVVNILLQVEEVLTVVLVIFDELTADGVHDVLHDGFNCREQEILLHHRQRDIQHQVVLQVLRRQAELRIEHDGRQSVNTECRDYL